jgi:hypothetical protein
MELPIYKLLITDDEDIEVNYVAIVDSPATQSYAAYFSAIPETIEHSFQVIDEARNIVGGYLMIADRPIKRVDKKGKEYFVVLDAENIDKAMIKFYEKGYQNNVNISHDKARKVEGMTLYQHFIINREMGVKAPKGFETEKDGSSFGFFKVKNKEVMDLVKSNKFGFSIEGMFKQEPVIMVSEEEANAIMNTLKKLHDKKII